MQHADVGQASRDLRLVLDPRVLMGLVEAFDQRAADALGRAVS